MMEFSTMRAAVNDISARLVGERNRLDQARAQIGAAESVLLNMPAQYAETLQAILDTKATSPAIDLLHEEANLLTAEMTMLTQKASDAKAAVDAVK